MQRTITVGRPYRDVEWKLLEAFGTDNMRERYQAGLLPDDELFRCARYELFTPFASFPRWDKIDAAELKHERGCENYGGTGTVSFTTRTPDNLTHNEWAVFKKITTAISVANNGPLAEHGVKATASLVEHVGCCSMCKAEIFGRAVNIRIEWAGRPLSREYTLEGEP